jgi:putative heme-binding domain-containing protein
MGMFALKSYVFAAGIFAVTAGALQAQQVTGDPIRGRDIFESKGGCLACHRVKDKGSRYGPDLSTIGVSRGRGGGPNISVTGTAAGDPKGLELAILDPDAEVALANRSVRVVTKEGTVITGRLLNHDNFSVQFIDTQSKLRAFMKSDLREFAVLTKSPMPSYKDMLNAQEVADLVSYLSSLKGTPKP